MPATIPDFLVFQLYGSLASWGDIAVGEYRPTQPYPSKSAVTGLLSASLGIRREDDKLQQSMNEHYGIAVCVQSQGELLRDYHTTQVPAGNKHWYTRKDELSFDPQGLKTILSQRDYQMDAFYLIAVWLKKEKTTSAPYSLEELSMALKRPAFTTCLGRKSCPPSLPYSPSISQNISLKNACDFYFKKAKEIDPEFQNNFIKDDLTSWYWESGLAESELGMKHTMTYPRRDQVKSRKRWQFSERDEFYYSEQSQGVQ
jgi:CRISPR system Cascade subunit CasD